MPEGDTIAKIATAIAPLLVGHVVRIEARDPTITRGSPSRVLSVTAKGKHLFVEFDNDRCVRTHLGMTGSWHRYAPNEAWQRPRWQASLVLTTDDEVIVCFNAKEIQLMAQGGLTRREFDARLGPDLISDFDESDATAARLVERARSRCHDKTLVADVLLDQTVAAGIGNVYKSELLFLHRLVPTTALGDVNDDLLAALYTQAGALLKANLHGGRRTTRFENDGRSSVWVYGRAGRGCLVCDTPIGRRKLGRHQRVTFWCPSCQH